MVYRNNTDRLSAVFISLCLETRCLVQNVVSMSRNDPVSGWPQKLEDLCPRTLSGPFFYIFAGTNTHETISHPPLVWTSSPPLSAPVLIETKWCWVTGQWLGLRGDGALLRAVALPLQRSRGMRMIGESPIILIGSTDILFKKTVCLMNICPQDLLSHEQTLLFSYHQLFWFRRTIFLSPQTATKSLNKCC